MIYIADDFARRVSWNYANSPFKWMLYDNLIINSWRCCFKKNRNSIFKYLDGCEKDQDTEYEGTDRINNNPLRFKVNHQSSNENSYKKIIFRVSNFFQDQFWSVQVVQALRVPIPESVKNDKTIKNFYKLSKAPFFYPILKTIPLLDAIHSIHRARCVVGMWYQTFWK